MCAPPFRGAFYSQPLALIQHHFRLQRPLLVPQPRNSVHRNTGAFVGPAPLSIPQFAILVCLPSYHRCAVALTCAQTPPAHVEGGLSRESITGDGKPHVVVPRSATRASSGDPVRRNIRVHDLKHRYGHRLRAAGVGFEDRKLLLSHKAGHVTTHYSAPRNRGADRRLGESLRGGVTQNSRTDRRGARAEAASVPFRAHRLQSIPDT